MKACQIGFNPEYQEENPTIEQISEINGYAVLEFGTSWCGHCVAAIPAVRQVLSGRELPHIKVVDGKGKSLGRAFKVKLWPTLILVNSGREIARLVRPVDIEEVKEFLAFAQP
jgi:thioredoxin 1